MLKTIKVGRKELEGAKECFRYMIIGPMCSAAYFHMALQYIFGSNSTVSSAIVLIDSSAKKIKFENVQDNETYFVLFEAVSSGLVGFEMVKSPDSEFLDSQLADTNRLKVMLPEEYLTLKIRQMSSQAKSTILELSDRLVSSRSRLLQASRTLKEEVGVASANFLAYAAEVNGYSYRKTLISPALTQVATEATTIARELKNLLEKLENEPVTKKSLSRVSPERQVPLVVTKKMMKEAGVSKEELRRFIRYTSRTSSQTQSEVQSEVVSPKASSQVHSHTSSVRYEKSSPGSEASTQRERKLITRLREKARISELALQRQTPAFLHDETSVSRVQLTLADGVFKAAGPGRGSKTFSYSVQDIENVRRSDEFDRTILVRFIGAKELIIEFGDDQTYENWGNAMEDQLAFARGCHSSPNKTREGLT